MPQIVAWWIRWAGNVPWVNSSTTPGSVTTKCIVSVYKMLWSWILCAITSKTDHSYTANWIFIHMPLIYHEYKYIFYSYAFKIYHMNISIYIYRYHWYHIHHSYIYIYIHIPKKKKISHPAGVHILKKTPPEPTKPWPSMARLRVVWSPGDPWETKKRDDIRNKKNMGKSRKIFMFPGKIHENHGTKPGWWFFATPLKNMRSSVGMIRIPILVGK